MSYSAEISRMNPSCLLFLLDQSGSMQGAWAGDVGKQKADGVATVVNRLIQNLVIKCAKSEGVRDYYDVGVIGYGSAVGSAYGGALLGRDLVPISEIADLPARIEERTRKTDDGIGGLIDQSVKFPVWIDPIANGGTPMCQAIDSARALLDQWVAGHPNAFPPIVINITDGEATDGDPSNSAEALKRLSTADGNVLLFNIHISSHHAMPQEFPCDDLALSDQYARLLFRNSSLLPDYMGQIASQENVNVSAGARGFAFNADMVTLIRFVDIGTRASNLR